MAMVTGAQQPLLGVVIAKFMTHLSMPFEYLVDPNDPTLKGQDYLRQFI